MGNKVNFKSGTPTDYNNTSHDDETFYHVVNDNATINHIYLGDLQLDNDVDAETITELQTDIASLKNNFNSSGQALDSAHADSATSITTATDTSNTLYSIGVTSGDTSSLKRDTNLTFKSGRIIGTYSGDPQWKVENTSSSGATSIQVVSDWANDGVGRTISLHIGSGGDNRGIYDNSKSAWIIYKDSSDAVHLGTSTVGGGTKPIYLSSGVPTASSSTVGSGTVPVYLSSGTITASSSTVGSASRPVYLNSGTITAMSGTLSTTYGGTGNSTGTATYVTTARDTSSTLYLLGVTSSATTTVKYLSSVMAIGATLYAGGTGTATTTHIQAGRIILYNSTPYIRFAAQDSSSYTHYIEANSAANLIAYPGISNSSDERLKHDIVDMPDKYVSLFDKLQPKEFRMDRGNCLKVGVIAQDILQSEEELGITESILVSGDGKINEDDDTNYYAVDYSAITIISINKIRQLEQEINDLKDLITKEGE